MERVTSPANHANEKARLERLREYHLLDTPPEPVFDDITRMIAEICEAPIAMLSLVDGQRQWIKARVGFDGLEFPRECPFCAYAILQPDEILQVEDATQDPRFADNPLVTASPHVRFYAGAPLVSFDGLPIGTLSVVDRRPRRLTSSQLLSLRTLAHLLVEKLENRRLASRKIGQISDYMPVLKPATGRLSSAKAFQKWTQDESVRLENVQRMAQIGTWQWELETNRVTWSAELYRLFGLKPNEIEVDYNTFLDRIHPEDRETIFQTVQQCLIDHQPYEFDHRVPWPDGSIHWLHGQGEVIVDENGEVTHMYGTAQDITERMLALESLHHSENRLSHLLSVTPAILYRLNPNGFTTTDVSGNVTALLGFESDEVFRPNWWLDNLHPDDREQALKVTARIFSEDHLVHEYRFFRKDGTVIWVRDELQLHRDVAGNPVEIAGAWVDITEQQRIKEALAAQKNQFEVAQRVAHIGSWEWDIVQNRSIWSDELYRLFGLEPHSVQLTQETFYSKIHPDDRALVRQRTEEALENHSSYALDYRIIRPDGSVCWLFEQAAVIKNSAGRATHLRGIAMDITERKLAEAERQRLFEAEKQARRMAEMLQAANFALTSSLDLPNILEVLLDSLTQMIPFDSANVMLLLDEHTLGLRAMRGYEAFTDTNLTGAITFDLRQNEMLRSLVSGQKGRVIPDTNQFPGWERPQGAEHVLSWIGVPLVAGGKTIGLFSLDKTIPGFFTEEHLHFAQMLTAPAAAAIQNALLVQRDRHHTAALEEQIRERQVVEQKLQDERDFARFVMNRMGQGLTITIENDEFEYVNPAFATMLGLTPEELIGKCVHEIIVPEESGLLDKQNQLRRANINSAYEIRLRHAAGHVVPVLVSAVPRVTKSGKAGAIAVVTDLTERNQVEEALRQSEHKYRLLFDSNPEAMWLFDPETLRFLAVNDEAIAKYGYSREEFLAMTIREIRREQDIPQLERYLATALDQPTSHGEFRHQKKDGTLIDVEIFAHGIILEGQKVRLVSAKDITERKRAEAKLKQREAILAAVAFAAERFLTAPHWEDEVDGILARLGKATGVSRIYVFENLPPAEGERFTSQRFEWCNAGIEPQIDNPDLKFLPIRAAGFGRWEDVLGNNEMIYGHVDTFPESEKAILQPQDIHSLVLVPVFVKGEWWGSVGFDQCHHVRDWSLAELEALKAAVNTLGAAIERKDAEDALRTSRGKLGNIIDSANLGTWEWNHQTGEIVVNERWAEIIGYELAEIAPLTGETWISYCRPEHLVLAEERMTALMNGESTYFDLECQMKHRDGHWIWVHDRGRIVSTTPDGRPEWIYGTHTDITDRKLAEEMVRESERNLQSFLNNAPDTIYKVDLTSWTIEYLNRDDFLGYERAALEAPGKPSLLFALHPEDRATVGAYWDKLAASPQEIIAPIHFRLQSAHGAWEWIQQRATVLTSRPDGTPRSLLITLSIITERMQAEANKIARQAAEQANEAKSEFLSRMSHELRTPLNSILGFGQLMEMSQKEPLTTGQHKRVDQILKAGQHLLNLINEVLDISKIEAGRMEISPEQVDVGRTLSEVLDLTIPLATTNQIRIHMLLENKRPIFVTADLQRLKQVLLNLVANAIKYNVIGGDVWLDCTPGPNGGWRISVRDTGPGLTAEQQERLFQPFERLGADSREVEGTGLGLALSKRLAELMGGSIGVESESGRGSTFWVDLPGADISFEVEKIAGGTGFLSPADAPGETRTLLYIEDNLANFELIQQLLAEVGQVDLIWSMEGQGGLNLAREHLPDLILLDLHLPDIPGREVLTRLRQHKETRHIPVIVISADATPHQIERLHAAGGDAYLTKPLNVSKFLTTIHTLLERN